MLRHPGWWTLKRKSSSFLLAALFGTAFLFHLGTLIVPRSVANANPGPVLLAQQWPPPGFDPDIRYNQPPPPPRPGGDSRYPPPARRPGRIDHYPDIDQGRSPLAPGPPPHRGPPGGEGWRGPSSPGPGRPGQRPPPFPEPIDRYPRPLPPPPGPGSYGWRGPLGPWRPDSKTSTQPPELGPELRFPGQPMPPPKPGNHDLPLHPRQQAERPDTKPPASGSREVAPITYTYGLG